METHTMRPYESLASLALYTYHTGGSKFQDPENKI
jgi:hypothetical protein